MWIVVKINGAPRVSLSSVFCSISRYLRGSDSGCVDLAAPPNAYLQTGLPDAVTNLSVNMRRFLSASLLIDAIRIIKATEDWCD